MQIVCKGPTYVGSPPLTFSKFVSHAKSIIEWQAISTCTCLIISFTRLVSRSLRLSFVTLQDTSYWLSAPLFGFCFALDITFPVAISTSHSFRQLTILNTGLSISPHHEVCFLDWFKIAVEFLPLFVFFYHYNSIHS